VSKEGKSEFIIRSSTADSFWLGLGFELEKGEFKPYDLVDTEIPNINIVTKSTVREISRSILYESSISSTDAEAKMKEDEYFKQYGNVQKVPQ